ncbi:MAG: prepilin-type N-terminal cleavage/methylation domain-containing protein [Akkermansiaceae bacterium]|nr:prepilin-type N-terminal cleavage/methylation domain-containing protein [Akkermansiaceae bacterium]
MIRKSPTRHSGGPFSRSFRKGFSLVELLAVMTIIAILLSLASVGINKIGKGQGVTAGMALGEGLLTQARSLAMNQNTRARLIIHSDLNDSDPEERERYRRLMMVVYKELDENGREKQEWTRAGSPTFLPKSVFFSPDLSRADMRSGGVLQTDNQQLSSQTSDVHQCYFYEFNGQGICSTPGAGFILKEGARPSGRERPILGGSRDVGGFVVLKNGSTTIIRDIKRLGVIGSD